MHDEYPVRFAVEYPDRNLDRLTTCFRIFTVIPIAIVLGSIGGYQSSGYHGDAQTSATIVIGGTGPALPAAAADDPVPPEVPALVVRLEPRAACASRNRVGAYFALMDDRYPSTDEQQWVHLDIAYPDAQRDLNRWLPLVKWLLAIPHYIVLFFLYIGGVLRGDRRVVRDPVHRPLPARAVRLRRGRDALAQPGRRLRVRSWSPTSTRRSGSARSRLT